MKVQTVLRVYDDVEINSDGSWTLRWTDSYGKPESYTYPKFWADIHSKDGTWKIIEDDKQVIYTTEHYAAAFNAWQDDYINNPQAFESSYDTAMLHVSEKLNGEEPSYGQVCSELFQEYLNKTLEAK